MGFQIWYRSKNGPIGGDGLFNFFGIASLLTILKNDLRNLATADFGHFLYDFG